MSTYTITVSGAELDVIRLAIGRMVTPIPVQVKRATVSHIAPYFDSGDSALDAFMASRWTPADRAAALKRQALPALPKLSKPRKRSTADVQSIAAFNRQAIGFWERAGHVVTITGNLPDADGSNVHVLPLGISA